VSAERSDAIRMAAAARSTDATARARRAVRELHRRGAEVSFAAVAAVAGVSRQFLYSHPELRDEIDKLRGERHAALSQIPADATRRSGRGYARHLMTTSGCVKRTQGCATSSLSRTAP
jgi:hypothetical protein